MKKSSLEIIQTFMKVGQVLSKVINVFCLIGVIGCVIGAVLLGTVQNVIVLGNITIHGLIDAKDYLSIGTGYTGLTIGVIACASQYFLSNKAYEYFTNELNANTPFTFEGAKELWNLGLYNIFVSLIAVIVSNIAFVTMSKLFTGVVEMNINNVETIGMGATMLALSVIFKYGAEVMEKAKENKKEDVEIN